MRSFVLISLVLMLPAASTLGITHYITADGNGDFPTIQAALIYAAPGDLILVADGTYTGAGNDALDFMGKAIVLMSEHGPAACIIDATFDRIFTFTSGEGPGSVVDGFTITSGSETNGGGIYIFNSSPTVVNNWIIDNYAENYGGGIYVAGPDSYPQIINNIIEDNRALGEGGGIYNTGHATLQNVTVVFNEAPFGSGMRFADNDAVTVTDCIFWGSFPGDQLDGAIWGTFDYNLVQGWVGPGNNFDGNPHFTAGPLGDRYLASNSDALDAGSSDAASACFTGGYGTICMDELTTRPDESFDTGTVDVGYHHDLGTHTYIVNPAGGGDFLTIQTAIGGALDGDTIELVNGTYTGPGNRNIDFGGKAVMVRSQSGDPTLCIVDVQASAADQHRAFVFQSGEGPGSVLQGIMIRNGYTWFAGGVLCEDGSSPTIINCIFDQNTVESTGGALSCHNGSAPTVTDCIFSNNQAATRGGAMRCFMGTPTVSGCEFYGNSAGEYGGAIRLDIYSSATFTDCQIYDNHCGVNGGAFSIVDQSEPTLEDCTIYGNTSDQDCGGIYFWNVPSPLLKDCTLYGNEGSDASGLSINYLSTPVIENCIIAFGLGGPAVHCTAGASATISCTDVYGNAGGNWAGCIAGQIKVNGNLNVDPLFCAAGSGDFTLADQSPCLPANNSCGVLIGAHGAGCSVTEVPEATQDLPTRYALDRNNPNPFNPVTTISYELPEPSLVQLVIYSVTGRRVATLIDAELPAGQHSVQWRGLDDHRRQVAAGVYLYRLRAGDFEQVRRMVLLK